MARKRSEREFLVNVMETRVYRVQYIVSAVDANAAVDRWKANGGKEFEVADERYQYAESATCEGAEVNE